MRWTIAAFGKLKESYWQQAAAEYLKRLQPYRAVSVVELPDERVDAGREEQAMQREAERALALVKPETYLVALSERGEQPDSPDLSARLTALDRGEHREVLFLIGGACGLAPGVLARANWRLGLSCMTMPHQLARVVLLEQLYRAERIRKGEPYHK
ncbi:MAG TPA: 23S rRNA (pseudouridine(1915)-N(3))-methyltransferase RlmH [Oscillatoriaceae cyanobacterium]